MTQINHHSAHDVRLKRATIAVIAPTYPPYRCGVGDYTAMLTEALCASGWHVHIFTTQREVQPTVSPQLTVSAVVPAWTVRQVWAVAAMVAHGRPEAVLLQYVPYLYARRGVGGAAPLLAWLLRLRGLRVVTVMHEPYVPLWKTLRWFVVGLIQRAMLLGVLSASAGVATSTGFWAGELRRWLPWYGQRIRRVAVGSNIPLLPFNAAERMAQRQRLDIAPHEVVLVFFGKLHVSKLIESVLRSPSYLRERGVPATLLMIGQDAAEVSPVMGRLGIAPDGVRCTGYSSVEDVSRYLHCADICLAPFIDGVSTRRTTVMAALQHGVAVVTTEGHSTERDLFAQDVAMTRAGDEHGFLEAVLQLARDPAQRTALAERGAQLYTREFHWPGIARQIEHLVGSNRRAPGGAADGEALG